MTGLFDVAVVGSGFAGSLAAMLARRVGRSVVLIERGSHPRFAIGESSSPLANLLLEELCARYELPRVRPLAAWGSWQREHPLISGGLKRGFTFYAHTFGHPFEADPERRNQLLVAASPNDDVADTHWYRADVDRFLMEEAARLGAEYLDRTEIASLQRPNGGFELSARREGRGRTLQARFVIDASGPGGFLSRALGLPSARFPALPASRGLYTHFRDVRRLDEMGIHPSLERPPYPVDDAAVHHVFPGGWIWVLRFNNGATSAGVAAAPELADSLRLQEGAPAWERLLEKLPTVREQFACARPVLPFMYRERLPFRTERAAREDWALLPSAAAFVDPILSTGFPLTLLGLERLATILETEWGRPSFPRALERYGDRTLFEADAAARLVSALYARFTDFPAFAALTLLYFAAAGFAEAARRLGRPELAGSFLCADHPAFGPALRRCCGMALDPETDRGALIREVRAAIEPLDVVGLSDESRRNWYPVEPGDLMAARHKLGATKSEIEALLRRSGLVAEPTAAPG